MHGIVGWNGGHPHPYYWAIDGRPAGKVKFLPAGMVRLSRNEPDTQRERSMLGNSTKMALIGILQSLETGDPSVWDEQNESGKYCLLELHQMSAPGYKGSRADGSNAEPARQNMKRAIPH